MKGKLLGLYYTFFLSLLTVLALSLFGGNPVVVFLLTSVALIASAFILKNWLVIIKQSVAETEIVLHQQREHVSPWSLDNIAQLHKNHQRLEKKLRTSAELITNLTHPERVEAVDELGTNDPIRLALDGIKSEMKKIKAEDEKRTWITQGIARFSEILRNKSEIKEYSYQIISNLVKYLNANQGGLFIQYQTAEGEQYLELMSSYAYGKRKYSDNRITEGQGLLGQCMLEKDFVLITDVPKDYVKITSGLGEAVPRCIVVAPLIFNETFCGVIELASFEVLKPHHMEFLKKICESIASEVASMKTMEKTKALLDESNVLAQELQSREEEMKQNMEELAATQEEMIRKQTELSGIINAIDSTLATAEFDMTGKLIKHNAILEDFFAGKQSYFENKNYMLITGSASSGIWSTILSGNTKSGDFKTRTALGTDLWLSVTFTSITDGNNNPVKVLCMIQDITQKKIKENEFERLSIVANNTDNSVIITNGEGYIEYVNSGFTKMTGYNTNEVLGKKPGVLLQGPLTDKKTIQKLSKFIASGEPVYEEILNYNKRKESYWVSLAINPVKDGNGNITKYISIQSDITQTKIKALDFHQKIEALSRSNAIIEIDKNGYLIDVNENYLELLGYSREELIGKSYSLLTRKENVFEKMMDTIDEQGMQSGTFSRYDKKGERHYMKLMDYPVLNLSGEIIKIIEFGVDVSNEKRLEKEAQRRQSELTSYLNGINNTIASAEFTMSGNFKDANEIFLKVLGFSKEDLNDKDFDFLMGEDPAVIMMWENLRLGKFFSGEFKMKNRTGKELWLTGTFNPITIENDVPEKIMMFAQFTTQEKEKLNDLNAMVNALKSTLPVIEFNPDFVCKTANEKALKMFGLSRLQLRSKTIFDFIAPYFHGMWNQNKNQIMTNDFVNFVIPFSLEEQIINYEVSVSVNRNLEGDIVKIIILLVKEATDKVPLLAAV